MEVHIDVSQSQVIMRRNFLVPDVDPITSENHFVDTLKSTRAPDGFFRSRCDQDLLAVKPMFEFDPCHESCDKFFSAPQQNGEQITEKGTNVLTNNF